MVRLLTSVALAALLAASQGILLRGRSDDVPGAVPVSEVGCCVFGCGRLLEVSISSATADAIGLRRVLCPPAPAADDAVAARVQGCPCGTQKSGMCIPCFEAQAPAADDAVAARIQGCPCGTQKSGMCIPCFEAAPVEAKSAKSAKRAT
jgi:hypothetical protein